MGYGHFRTFSLFLLFIGMTGLQLLWSASEPDPMGKITALHGLPRP